MINKTRIEELVREYTTDKDIFVVSISVSTGNKITVLVNRKDGITIDECVRLSRHIESGLDRDTEDFELSVSSPGIGEALLVREQYEMSIGRRLEVVDNEGKTYKGIMKSFAGDSFVMEIKHRGKGKKGEMAEKAFKISEIRSAKVLITFKK